MTFHENDSRICKDYFAENMAGVRHAALDMRKTHPEKITFVSEGCRCFYTTDFMVKGLCSIYV